MNIQAALNSGTEQIKKAKIDQPEREAEEILAFVLGKKREFLFTHPEFDLNFWQQRRFDRMTRRRLSGVPLAYVIGYQEFYGLDFKVNKNVLIPRPETELMVDEILKRLNKGRMGMISTWEKKMAIKNIIDLGTGSGCIIISLAKNAHNDQIKYWGLDVSRPALAVARRNARENGLRGCIKFLYGNLFNSIDKNIFKRPTIIAANLPYLTPGQISSAPDLKSEPVKALLSGNDGLDHYRRLFKQINQRLGTLKNNIMLYCEIDESQKKSMAKLIREDFPHSHLEFLKDLNGYDRLVVIKP